MDKGGHNLKINIDPILDHFECLVCMNHFRSPHITKCGHSFCEECIFECLNLNKECPHCKKPCQKEDVIKNYQLEDLLRQLLDAKKAESEKYYENMANNIGDDDDKQDILNKSPIETVFLFNLREGLLKYQKHYESLLEEKSKILDQVDGKFAIKLMEEGDENKKAIEIQKQERTEEIEHKFTEVIDMLVQSYSRNSAIPEPGSLPIKTNVQLINKGIEFKDVIMRPYDCMNDIKRFVEQKLAEKQNPIEEWGGDVEIIIRGALANKPRANEEMKDEWDIDAGMNPDDVLGKTIKVDNMMTTREKLGIENGSIIEIFGTIKCKSDMPKKCMKVDFNKDDQLEFNYYKCATCNKKWICEPCMEKCHLPLGHDLQPFLMNHVPDWACCYCSKTKKCCIKK